MSCLETKAMEITQAGLKRNSMRWRASIILLGLSLVRAPQVLASAPDPNRPIKQMRHSSWNEASGLSGTVYALAQTSDGFLWVGTTMGLYRFDGLKFDSFRQLAGDNPVLEIRTLLATSDGGLWIGYRNGVAFLKQDQAAVYSEQQGLPYGWIRGLAQTQDGAIWASGDGGLARFSNGHWEKIHSDWNYPANSAEKMIVDDTGTLWVTGGESIHYLPRGSRQFQQTAVKVSSWTEVCKGTDGSIWIIDPVAHNLFNFKKSPQENHFVVNADPLQDINEIRFDGAHAFWLAAGRGLYRLPPASIPSLPKQTNSETEKDQFMVADGLSGREANAVLEDREGNIWVGTSGGLDRFSDRSVTLINIGHTPADLITGPHSEVWASPWGASPYLTPLHDAKPYFLSKWWTNGIYMDRTGTLWSGMQSHSSWEKSRALWKDNNGIVVKVPSPPDLEEPLIDGITGDATGRLWMTIKGRGEYTLQDGQWNLVPVFTGSDSNIAPDAHFIDSIGRAWLMYYARNTVVMVDGTHRIFFTSDHELPLGNPISGRASGSQVWISGTKGLGFFDGERFQNIHATGGSSFANVSAVIPTEHDGLWLKAPEGVIQIPPDEITAFIHDHTHTVRYRTFDAATDFATPLARRLASTSGTDAVRSSDGKLWFSVITGAAMIDPAHLAKNDALPPVFIRSLTANGRTYSTYHDVTLPKSTHELSLDYTALSLTLSERNRFRYQLVGLDKQWQDAGTRRQAFYTNLSPGTYTFKVIASNNDGVWNDAGTSFTFTIPPTFFQTIWFDLLLAAIAICLLWVAYILRLRRATEQVSARLGERLQERERIARELHDTLLQNFQAIILRFQIVANKLGNEDPNRIAMENGLDYADRVLFDGRNQIRGIRTDINALDELSTLLSTYGDELAHLWPLKFHLTLRGTPFGLNPVVRDEIHLIGREALGNAFKHSNGSVVEIEISYLAAEFRMRVSDDGAGIDPEIADRGRPGHWGIDNMRERARKIGAHFKITGHPKSGTTVELTISLGLAKDRRVPWFPSFRRKS